MNAGERIGRWLAWLAAAVGAGAAGWAVAAPIGPRSVEHGPGLPRHEAAATNRSLAVTPPRALGARVVRGNLFRLGRRPAVRLFDPAGAADDAQTVEPPPRPALTLVGLVEGREDVALIEGLPGIIGARALRVGEGAGGLVVQHIGGGRVVVVGSDTTWVLRVREAWR